MLLITRNSRVAALAMSAAPASRYGSGDVFLKDAILRIRSPGAWSNRRVVDAATRQYGRSLEPLSADVRTQGTSKSAVSRRFVAAFPLL